LLRGPDIARYSSIGVGQAHRTLLAASRFLGSGLACSNGAAIAGRYRAKVLGNGLRELDRFLSVLLDEVAWAAGWDGAEHLALVRLRHTADKLGHVRSRPGVTDGDVARLRALAHCRNILFHCNGLVRRGDTRHAASLTLGWPANADEGQAATILRVGERLAVSPAELLWVCALYCRIGDALVRGLGDLAIRPDIRHIGSANVACDGI
jgi:hypothetical protein